MNANDGEMDANDGEVMVGTPYWGDGAAALHGRLGQRDRGRWESVLGLKLSATQGDGMWACGRGLSYRGLSERRSSISCYAG